MHIELRKRTRQNVEIYFYKTQNAQIQATLPSSTTTLEESLSLYEASISENATSFGQSIYVDETYVGDIWCYGIDETNEKMAMLSFCLFEKDYWHKGIMSQTIELFIPQIFNQYSIQKLGAFCFEDNIASIKALIKNQFKVIESFIEEDRASVYLEYQPVVS